MSLQEILWLIPFASFVLALILIRQSGRSLAGVSDSSVKEVRLAEERARQLLAGGREALEYGGEAIDPVRTSPNIDERPARRKRKRSALASGVIDRGPVPHAFLSRGASPSAEGRYVAAVRGGVIRPRRLVFLNPAPVVLGLARAVRRRIPTV